MMRLLKTKWRAGSGGPKDRVKEASRRLRVILRTSKKLGVAAEDLKQLEVMEQLRTSCRGTDQEHNGWLLPLSVHCVILLITSALLMMFCGGLEDLLGCANNTTKEIQIPTIRLDRLPLDGSSEAGEESSLFNDSEDAEDGHLWQPPSLRLRRER